MFGVVDLFTILKEHQAQCCDLYPNINEIVLGVLDFEGSLQTQPMYGTGNAKCSLLSPPINQKPRSKFLTC